MVKLTTFTEHGDKYNRKSDGYVNPDASTDTLLEFAHKMNNLTDNTFGEAYRQDGAEEIDLTPITRGNAEDIVARRQARFDDNLPITRADIESIVRR